MCSPAHYTGLSRVERGGYPFGYLCEPAGIDYDLPFMPEEVFDEVKCASPESECTSMPTIGVEWEEDDSPRPVSIVHFDFAQVERLEDLAREALQAGRLKEFLEEWGEMRFAPERQEIVSRIVGEGIKAKNARMALVQMASAAGMAVAYTKTDEEWAEFFGVTKQAMQQGIDRARKMFGMRKTRAMRDDDARETMRTNNYRPKEKLPA
jgi:hypothetical protein